MDSETVDKVTTKIKELSDEVKKYKQRNRDIKNVLQDITWEGHKGSHPACIWCGECQYEGHDVLCELNKVLHE